MFEYWEQIGKFIVVEIFMSEIFYFQENLNGFSTQWIVSSAVKKACQVCLVAGFVKFCLSKIPANWKESSF